MYTAHNYQFLAFSTSMQGRKAETSTRHDDRAKSCPTICCSECLGCDWYVAEHYAAMVRFGMWDEILAEPGRMRS